jgi:hypothetical protein
LITTLIGCKNDEWETYTVQNLYYASNYKISGNNLAIYTNGAYNLYFTRTNYGGGMVNLIIAGSTNGDKVTVRTYGDGVISDENVELDSRKNFNKDVVISFTATSIPSTEFEVSTKVMAFKGNDTLVVPLNSGKLKY